MAVVDETFARCDPRVGHDRNPSTGEREEETPGVGGRCERVPKSNWSQQPRRPRPTRGWQLIRTDVRAPASKQVPSLPVEWVLEFPHNRFQRVGRREESDDLPVRDDEREFLIFGLELVEGVTHVRLRS